MIGTTIDESKKLLEAGLGVRTADMYWEPDQNCLMEVYDLHSAYRFNEREIIEYCKRPNVTPAWSLTTLLDMLPSAIEMNGHFFCLKIGRLADDVSWYISYDHEGWTANIVKGLTLMGCVQTMIIWLIHKGHIEVDK